MKRYFSLLLIALTLGSAASAPAASDRAKELGDVLQQFTDATLYNWTDKLGYGTSETVTVRWTTHPRNDPYPYTHFTYLENITTGERWYVANGTLSTAPMDIFGNAAGAYLPVAIPMQEGGVLISTTPPSAGLWHFVSELRSIDATQVIKAAHAKFVVTDNEVVLGGEGTDTEISTDTTWTNDTIYKVQHQVFINPGATLTIEPGTLILAKKQNAVIIVERGAKMIAAGRKELPIVMTCDAPVGDRFSGCWAGLIVLGAAPVNLGGVPLAEGILPATRPVYGGTNSDDSSGVYTYLRVEFAGIDVSNEIQPNAFGFHGVGRGTVVHHIQAHDGEDDGIEFFGGTVDCKYCISDGSKDDSFDWALGWTGRGQYWFALQDDVDADRGIEADNNENGFNNEPRSNPDLRNATFVGSSVGNRPILLRRGTAAQITNFVLLNFANDLEAADNSVDLVNDGTTSFTNMILWGNNGTFDATQIDANIRTTLSAEPTIFLTDPKLRNVRYEGNPDPRPLEGSPATQIGAFSTPPSDGCFDTGAQCVGGFCQDNWLKEWTFFGTEEQYAAGL